MDSQKKQPMSSAERKSKQRNKDLAAMNEDQLKEFRASESKRRSKPRKKQLAKMSKEELDAYRKRDSERKKKKSTSTTSTPEPCSSSTPLNHYRSKQSFSKALNKTLDSLPKSPRKRSSVVAGLAKSVGLKLESKMQKATRWNATKEIEEDVVSFYFRPDISYTMPGKFVAK